MKYALLLTAIIVPFLVPAQDSYVVQQTTEPYVELASPTPCTFVEGFDQVSELAGETFDFFGVPVALGLDPLVWIGDFGFVRFDTQSASVIIDGLFTYLEPVDGTSNVSYSITGAPGSRTLVVQWHNWELTNGPDGNYANWQIAIEQATGIVEIRFGPNSGGGMIYTDLNGPNCGIFRANIAFTQCYDKMWFEQDAYDPHIDSLPNFDFDALHNLPPANTVYRLTPTADFTGTNELMTGELSVRVIDDGLDVQLPGDQHDGILRVTDTSGKEVLRVPVRDTRPSIDLGTLAGGSYVATFIAQGTQWNARFVIGR